MTCSRRKIIFLTQFRDQWLLGDHIWYSNFYFQSNEANRLFSFERLILYVIRVRKCYTVSMEFNKDLWSFWRCHEYSLCVHCQTRTSESLGSPRIDMGDYLLSTSWSPPSLDIRACSLHLNTGSTELCLECQEDIWTLHLRGKSISHPASDDINIRRKRQ